MRVDPEALDRALGSWNAPWAPRDRSLAIDRKTLRGASDEHGLQVHVMSAVGHESKAAHTQNISGLSVDYGDELKRTHEIKTAAPLPGVVDIAGLDINSDALLTQRDLAKYVVARGAQYHFSVKGNQPTLQESIRLLFERRGRAEYSETLPPQHGRIETRRLWCSSRLNDDLDFPPRRPGLPHRV